MERRRRLSPAPLRGRRCGLVHFPAAAGEASRPAFAPNSTTSPGRDLMPNANAIPRYRPRPSRRELLAPLLALERPSAGASAGPDARSARLSRSRGRRPEPHGLRAASGRHRGLQCSRRRRRRPPRGLRRAAAESRPGRGQRHRVPPASQRPQRLSQSRLHDPRQVAHPALAGPRDRRIPAQPSGRRDAAQHLPAHGLQQVAAARGAGRLLAQPLQRLRLRELHPGDLRPLRPRRHPAPTSSATSAPCSRR